MSSDIWQLMRYLKISMMLTKIRAHMSYRSSAPGDSVWISYLMAVASQEVPSGSPGMTHTT